MKEPKGGARVGAGRKSRFDTVRGFRCKSVEHRAIGDHELRFIIRKYKNLCLHLDTIIQNQYTRDITCSACGEWNPEDFSSLAAQPKNEERPIEPVIVHADDTSVAHDIFVALQK